MPNRPKNSAPASRAAPADRRYYPLALDLRARRVVVLGGGQIATRKTAALLDTGARVIVISPAVSARLTRWAREGRIHLRRRRYRRGDLSGACLAIAATSMPEEHAKIAAEARRTATWLLVVDEPALCDFIAPAVITRGDLTMTISTNGRSPALARWLKSKLQGLIGEEYGRLTTLLGAIRSDLREAGHSPSARSAMIDRLMTSRLLAQLRHHDQAGVLRTVRRITGLTFVTVPRRAPQVRQRPD
ncbi:MAG: bifunctional precorrin-2 dehydrogenase/sirohydrochlorin ferrochelatase [Nitrospirae bacterium]|nr:bifunctional precorrin-2 dehydrogenase/sirohydrochlorin ferrochelatase [Nitrospirota bacterium]